MQTYWMAQANTQKIIKTQTYEVKLIKNQL